VISDGQSVFLTDVEGFTKELNELMEIELDIGINKIEFDLEKKLVCTIEEMVILLSLLDVE